MRSVVRNKLQVIKQFEQEGTHANRYDVTILVNGLPLVQIELKRRGVAIREAFNQIHRYSKESFNSKHSLFKYLQMFVISNGTDSRYFANTTTRNKNSFDFTMNWAKADNSLIKDIKDFTATFFQQKTLLNVLLHYSVFAAKRAALKLVRVLPEPVVCQIYPPLSALPQLFASYELRIFHIMRSVAAIW
jgi:type I restriction enzyme R subunit